MGIRGHERKLWLTLLVLFSDLPRTEHKSWLPAIVFTIKTLLKQEASKTPDNREDEEHTVNKLPPCSDFMTNQTTVQFKCDGVDVTLTPINDWEPMGGFTALCKQCMSQPADAQMLWVTWGWDQKEGRGWRKVFFTSLRHPAQTTHSPMSNGQLTIVISNSSLSFKLT